MAEPLVGVKKEEKVDEAKISLNNQLVNISRRLQILEGKHDNLRSKTTLFENNNTDLTNSLRNDINKINQEIGNLKTDVKKTNDTLKLVIEELKLRAKDSDLKVLEKYVDFFNPLKYTTEKEVRAIISEMTVENKNHLQISKESEDKNEQNNENNDDELNIDKIEKQILENKNKLRKLETISKKEKINKYDDSSSDEERNDKTEAKKYKITDLL